jgi:hypothetical protein
VKPNNTQYRINSPLRAVHVSPGEHGVVTIPKNSILRVISLLDGGYLIRAQWDNEQLVIFTRDLEEKAILSDSGRN